MLIGIPKEVKDNESRVALTPEGAAALAAAGHEVRVEGRHQVKEIITLESDSFAFINR